MYCTNCGFKNADHAFFCQNCGKPLQQMPPVSGQPIPQQPSGQPIPQQSTGQPDTAATWQQSIPSQGQGEPQQFQQPGQEQQPFNQQPPQPFSQPQSQPFNQQPPQPFGQQEQQPPQPFGQQPSQPFGRQPSQPFGQQPQQQYQPFPPPAPQQGPFYTAPVSTGPKKKKKKFLPWIIAVILIAAAAIIAGVVFLFPKKTPILDNILEAVNGTLKAESLEFTVKCDIEGYDRMKADGVITNDLNKRNLGFDINAETMEYILLKNNFIVYDKVYNDGYIEYRQDITEELKLFYDYYEEYQASLKNKKDMDWKDAIRTAGLSSFIDEDELGDCISQLKEKFNDKDFYKTVCKEFTVKKTDAGTEYFFDVNPSEMVSSVLEILEPAIIYDDMDGFTEDLTDLADEITKLTIKITTAKGRLAGLEFIYSADDSSDIAGEISIEIEFGKYNEASLDEDRLAELVDAANSITSEEAPDEAIVAPTQEPAPNPTSVPDTLGYADLDLWYIGYGEGDPVIEDSISRFMADNPQCNVNVSVMDSSEYYMRLETAMAADDMPDIFVTWANHTFCNYVTDGQVLDITDYMQRDGYRDRFLDAGISQVTYEDKIYGVPVGAAAIYGIYYNKAIFNRYGIQEPSTIAELEQICDTLAENGITPFELGNSVYFFGSMYFSCLSARRSGIDPFAAFYKGDRDAIKYGFLYAGEKLQEWIGKGYFNEEFNYTDDSVARTDFCNGNGAMYLSGSWSTYSLRSEMPDYPDNVGFFAFPAYSEGDANSSLVIGTVGDTFYSVGSTCDNPEAAFKAITYLIDNSAIEQRIANGNLPPVKGFVPEDVIEQKIMEIINKADAVHQIYDTYLPSDAASIYYNGLYGLFDLSVRPEEFYDTVISGLPY
jgi:raffinose/stachyose/melibiose transport system substrate-binding protein